MKYYGGIDPGLKGAVVVVDENGTFVDGAVMPLFADRVDSGALYRLIESMSRDRDIHFAVEKAFVLPKQGTISCFNYGMFAGYCEMALAILGIPYEMVMPKAWQTVIHQGIDSRIKLPKLRSAVKVQRLMGLDRFMIGKKVKNPHEGLVDAYLIAVYCQRVVSGSRQRVEVPEKKRRRRRPKSDVA